MKRLNENITVQREEELISALYDHMCHNVEDVENDIEHDYITCCNGNDGNTYFWYIDENKSVAIDMDGNIIDEEDDSLNGILYND